MRGCSRCLMDETVPGIRYDQAGQCHLCAVQDRLAARFQTNDTATRSSRLQRIVDTIKKAGRNKPYDCIVPISGGGDSSYALLATTKLGLRPLAYHFDNGWVSDVARHNLKVVTEGLGVPLKTVSYPQRALMEAYKACLRASIPEACLPCLIAIWSLSYKAAEAEQVRYVIHGSSPLTEGITPLRWSYGEGRYLQDVVKRFASPEARRVVADFNRLTVGRVAVNTLVNPTKILMLPLYMDWNDVVNKKELQDSFGWIDGGKHSDCLYTPFRNWYIQKKFGFDLRRLSPSALIRSGRLTREEGIARVSASQTLDPKLEAHVLASLSMTRNELDDLLSLPPKSFLDYSTYYPFVRASKPLIYFGTRVGLLSEFVYDKYFEC